MNRFTESQGTLARLLATENISIQHGAYDTAFFDVKNRILGLPIWKNIDKDIYDLLCGHEVGHALYTPADALDNCPHLRKDYLNVVEDVRIEAMIQSTYPGLIACFRRGYASFMARDFFGLKGRDVNSLNFPDRINLKAKLGDLITVAFTPAEEAIRAQIHAAKTWDDVIKATEALQAFVAKQLEEERKSKTAKSGQKAPAQDQTEDDNDDSFGSDSSDDTNDGAQEQSVSQQTSASGADDSEESEKSKSMSSTQEADEAGQEVDTSTQADASEADADKSNTDSAPTSTAADRTDRHAAPTPTNYLPAAETTSALSEQTKQLLDISAETLSTLYCKAPSRAECDEVIISAVSMLESRRANFAVRGIDAIIADPQFQARFASFMKQTKRVVANMVKEFELRKAAYQYSRASVAKTGSLNLNKLHAYRTSDDLFLSVTNLANAKNHALVLFVDYSGSMERVLPDVLKHVINLALFCRQASIPYRIFGFTSDASFNAAASRPPRTKYWMESDEAGYNRVLISNANLIELVSSDLTTAQFNEAVTHLYLRADSGYCAPGETLGNTPLDETLIAAHQIVKDMQAKYNPDRMITMFITDGDGQRLKAVQSTISRDNEMSKAYDHKHKVVFTLNGQQIAPTDKYSYTHTKELLNNLRKTTGTELIGFFIPHNKAAAKSQISKILGDQKPKNYSEVGMKYHTAYNDDEILHVPEAFGYDNYFVVAPSNSLSIDEDELEIDPGATRARIARQFINFSQSKKSSRVFVNKFAQAIA